MDDSNEQFRNIEEIPLPYRNIFDDYPCFNAVQSKVLDDILYTDYSVVISSPTGSGKTVLFELAIARLLMQRENMEISQDVKIVYISPIKSLCQERLVDWHKKFSSLGLNCASFTGDSDNVDFQQLTNHNLIISTPEKWDSLTRRWRDNKEIVKVVKLFLIDEVHLLNEENRGSTLEVIVSRMKTVEKSVVLNYDGNAYNQKIRFIALSATVPNVEDIAEWLGKPPNIKFHRFSEEMRPVKLKKIILGYSYNPKITAPFKFDLSLNYKLQSLIMQYSEGKPTLIFCSTRKSVEMTANHIVQTLRIHLNNEQIQKLLAVANLITDSKAKATIKHGVGYHHAGMIPETRHTIENLFRNGDLPVLVTTSTLAMGVNLPAHLVIIKSTKCYDNGGFRDYTETAIHQMIGRAGRPQFDTSATALILTTNEDKPKFQKMVGCGQPIESNLHRHLIEHVNAEVVLRTITDLEVAMQWLASTFLYVRARKNPGHYGLNMGLNKDQIDKKLLEMCQIDLNKLVKAGMLTIDENINITPTITGQIMAKFYVAFETMKLFTQLSGTEILIQILELISRCHEFSEVRLRVNDKKTLNLLNKNSHKNTIRFPLSGKIKTWNMKVNCLIQAILGNLDISDHSILSETFTIMRNGERITKCLIEYLETRKTNSYSALLNAIILCKCFQAKLWENSPYVSKQLTGIGSVMSNQLVNAGKTTFRKILESNPRDIEMVIKRKPPMGNTLIEEVQHIPIYEMTLEKVNEGKRIKIFIRLINAEDVREKSTVHTNSVMALIVGNNLNQLLIYEKYRHSYMIENGTLQKFVDLNEEYTEINAHFISNDWVGIDCNATVSFKPSSNSSTPVIEKTENKRNPTYIQMFLDMYMKSKKKPTDKVKTGKISKKNANNETEGGKKNTSKKVCIGISRKEKMGKSGRIKTSEGNRDKITEVNNEDIPNGANFQVMDANQSQRNQLNGPRSNLDIPQSNLTEQINPTVDEVTQIDCLKDDVSNASSTSLFSNELSTSVFAGHMEKMNDEIMKEMQNAKSADENMEDSTFKGPEKPLVERFNGNPKNSMEIEGKVEDSNAKPILDFDTKMSENPSTFRISQKYITDEYAVDGDVRTKPKDRKKGKRENMRVALSFEGSKEDAKKRQKLTEFKFPNKRKFTHRPNVEDQPDSTQGQKFYAITKMLEPDNKNQNWASERNGSEKSMTDIGVRSRDEGNMENAQKSITWRSPLVFSPAVKFSPKLNYPNGSFREDVETDLQHENTNETLETSTSSRGTTNLTINIQRTPKQSKNMSNMSIFRSRGTKFPLCDKDCKGDEGASEGNRTQELQKDDSLDFCSTSFLEKLGMSKSNQYKSTPRRTRHNESAPAANYYSQLISHPVHFQKDNKQKEDINSSKQFTEDLENLTQKTAAIAEKRENESRRTSELNEKKCSVGEQINRHSKQDPDGFKDFILAQNRPLEHNKTLDYLANNEVSESRVKNFNTSICQNFIPTSNESFRDYPYGLHNSHPNFHENPISYRSHNNILRPIHLNETITSNGYQDSHRYTCTQQCCQLARKMCGNPYFFPRPVCRNNFENIPQLTQRNMNRSRLNDSFTNNFNQTSTLNSSKYFENYDFPHRGQYFDEENRPPYNLHRDIQYPKYASYQRDSLTDNISNMHPMNHNYTPHQRCIEANFSQETNPKYITTSVYKPDHEQVSNCRPYRFVQQNNPQRGSPAPGDEWAKCETAAHRSFEDRLDERMIGRLNRSLSFEEKPRLKEEKVNLMQKQDFNDRVYREQRQGSDLNNSFMARNPGYPQEWDYCQGNFNCEPQISGYCNRGVAEPMGWPCQQGCWPARGGDLEIYPSSNDKEYVMKKFLYSLSQE